MLSFMRPSEDLAAGQGRYRSGCGLSLPNPQHPQTLFSPWRLKHHPPEQGRVCCLYFCTEQAKLACSRILKGPTPKCLSGLSWVQASSAQHSSAGREAPERVSIQCSQRVSEQDLEGIILGGK